MINNIIKFLLLFFLLFLISCKKIEILNPVIIDYDKLARISINAENKKIGILFESTFQEPYIDHSLTKSPIYSHKNSLLPFSYPCAGFGNIGIWFPMLVNIGEL